VVLDELLRYQDFGIDPVIVVMADRPAPEVSALIESLPRRMVVRVCPPNPIVTSSGLAFRQAKIAHYRVLKGLGRPIDWVLLQDDDRWFEPLGITEELPKALEQPVDLLYARSAFLWDDSEHVNVARYHVSPTLFRFDPDSDFPDDQDVQAPQPLHDRAIIARRTAVLETPLIDAGSLEATERDRLFNTFIAAGKNDDYVRSLKDPPTLVPFSQINNNRPWKDLLCHPAQIHSASK